MDEATRRIDLGRVRGPDLAERLRALWTTRPARRAAEEVRAHLEGLPAAAGPPRARAGECLAAAEVLAAHGLPALARVLLARSAHILTLQGHFRDAARLHAAFDRLQRGD